MTLPRLRSLTRAALAPLLLVTLVGCAPLYGANFDFPDALPVQQSATVVLSDEGSDDDDPMRSRQQVIDVPADSAAALLTFYHQTFPATKGWTDEPVHGDQELCLVNRSNDQYTEVVEVFSYTGSRVPVQPGRHLVMISRLQDTGDEDPCGLANAWVASDLF
jgi:hypothetical protein